MEKTQGFVLKSLKYGDTSVILHIYTQSHGMQSFLIKGFFTKKKLNQRHLQYPFSLVEITFKPSNKSDLHLPRQIQLADYYVDAHNNPVKLIILQFLAEVIYFVLREDQHNPDIFLHIEQQMKLFNQKSNRFSDFHLFFLSALTKYLGFQPNMRSSDLPYFDLEEANFISGNAQYRLSEEETKNWKLLFTSKFSGESVIRFSSASRQQLTTNLLNYYKLHVPGFREPQSLEILKQILHA